MLGAALVLSVTALMALGARRGPMMWSRAVGLAESHDREAYLTLEASKAPDALAKAAIEAQKAVDLAPYNNAARLRMAYISTLQQHRLQGAGLKRFSESYDLMPYDHTVAAWRIGFGLEHWPELTPELRGAVRAEAAAFLIGRHGADVEIRRVLDSVRNPEGRLAAALWLQELHI